MNEEAIAIIVIGILAIMVVYFQSKLNQKQNECIDSLVKRIEDLENKT